MEVESAWQPGSLLCYLLDNSYIRSYDLLMYSAAVLELGDDEVDPKQLSALIDRL
jgi:hypothetical protein